MPVAAFALLAARGAISEEARPTLSEKQLAAIASRTTAMSEAERAVVSGWSPGKKAAEFFCRDLALVTLRERYERADRVFLEATNSGVEPTLVSDSLVEGAGTVRYDGGWADFRYACTLDPARGTATRFRFFPTSQE